MRLLSPSLKAPGCNANEREPDEPLSGPRARHPSALAAGKPGGAPYCAFNLAFSLKYSSYFYLLFEVFFPSSTSNFQIIFFACFPLLAGAHLRKSTKFPLAVCLSIYLSNQIQIAHTETKFLTGFWGFGVLGFWV